VDDSYAKGSSIVSFNATSTAVKDDRKRLEKLRNKQVKFLINIPDMGASDNDR